MTSITTSVAEQAGGAGQLAASVADLRVRAREIASAVTPQTTTTALVAAEVSKIAGQTTLLRAAHGNNADGIGVVVDALRALANASRPPEPATERT